MVQKHLLNLYPARTAGMLSGARRVAMLLAVMLLTMTAQTAWAQVQFDWNSDAKTLTISGSGEIPSDWGEENNEYREQVEIVVINDVTIGNAAFQGCSALQSVSIGSGVTSIGDEAFQGCIALTTITVSEDNTNFKSVNNVLFTYAGTKLTTLIQYPIASTATSYTIPDDVTTIGINAFRDCSSLLTVTIGSSVETIGNYAFYECSNLSTVTMGSSVKTIGENAFNRCQALTSITIPASVTSIGGYAFWYLNNLNTVYVLPSTLPTLGVEVFNGFNGTFYVHGEAYNEWGGEWGGNKTTIYSVTLGTGITATGTPTISHGGKDYYVEADVVTLSGSTYYMITKDADGSDVTASVLDGSTLTMPAYDVTITAASAPRTATAPTITTQPGDLELTYGYTSGNTLTVVASAAEGHNLSYQWYSCEDADKENPQSIDNATGASYTIPTGLSVGTTKYYYCVVTATRTDNSQTAIATSSVATVTINQAKPTVSTPPTAAAITYGQTLSESYVNGTAKGVNGEELAGTWTWVSASTMPKVSDSGTTGYSVTFTPSNTNYESYSTTTTLTVNPKSVTVDGITVDNKTYDGTATATLNAANATVNGKVGDDDVTVDASNAAAEFANANAGTGKAVTITGVTLSGTGAGNYTLSGQPTGITANITPAALTVTAKPKTISYGDAPANDGVTYSGFVNGEGASVLSGTLSYAYKTNNDGTGNNYMASSPVGTYYIIPGGLTAANYEITFAAGTLTVEPKEVTPSITVREMGYDGNPINISEFVTIKESDAEDAPDIDPSEYTLTIMQGENVIQPENLKHSGEYTIYITDAKTDEADCGNYTINDAYNDFSISQQTTQTSYKDGEDEVPVDNAIVLEGHETTLSDGWYVCNAALSYNHGIELSDGDGVNIIIEDGAALNIETSEESGLYGGSLKIYGQNKETSLLNINATGDNYAINASDFTLTNAKVTAEGADGIYASGALSISGGTVEATASGDDGNGLYAVGAVEISNESVVTASAKQYGIYSETNVTISGGNVTAEGTSEKGIYTTGNISIAKSDEAESLKVTASGGYGIYSSDGDISIENCEVNATGTASDAINASTITLTNATVTAEGADGIYASGALSISGGTVTAAATGDNGYGLHADDALTIDGGNVDATGKGTYAAIHSEDGDITMRNSDITATSEDAYAIKASDGALTISGGKVTATATGDDGNGLYASGEINISWTDKDNDFITASSYDGNVVVADGKHFRAVSGENTIAFISGTLDKDEDEELISSLAGTTLKPFETEGYVVTVVGDDLTAGNEPDYTNGTTKFYVYDEGDEVTVGYVGVGIVEVMGMDADEFSADHTFTMPQEDVILTATLLDEEFHLSGNIIDYNEDIQKPGIQYADEVFDEDNYTLSYTKDGADAPTDEAQYPGTYAVTLTGQGAYIGEKDIEEEFVINPSPEFSTTLFAEGAMNQWMTWCGTDELVIPDDVTIYTVTGYADGNVMLSEMDRTATFGDDIMTVIPAYTPVLLYRTTVDNDAVTAMFYSPATGTDGVQTAEGTEGCTFYGTTTDLATIPEANYSAGLTYVLYGDKFLKSDNNSGIAANRCWLKLEAGGGTSGARLLSIVIDDNPTAIDNVQWSMVNGQSDSWYTIDGRKLNGKPTKKGLYIYNGKKVAIK